MGSTIGRVHAPAVAAALGSLALSALALAACSGGAAAPAARTQPPTRAPVTSSPPPLLPSIPPSTPPPAPPLEHVAPAVPTAFVMHGPAFTIRAQVCSMPFVRPLDPPGEQHHTVCWVDSAMGADFGVAPASPSRGTSYLLGHAWAEDPHEVLNPMSKRAMRQVDFGHPSFAGDAAIYPVTDLNGYTVTLTTANGRLTYRVTRTFAVNKAHAGDVASVMAQHRPNRLVLITCGVRDGIDVDVNVISYATLVRAVATPSTRG